MNHSFSFDISFTDDQEKYLLKVLCHDNPQVFKDKISKIAQTAFNEYLDMITNQGIPSRNQDMKISRLSFLIETFFEDQIPTENEVVSLFRITDRVAKTLIEDTLSKNQNRIQTQLENSIIQAIKLFEKNPDNNNEYEGVLTSKILLNKINEVISQEEPGLDRIRSKKATAGKYICPVDTYLFLKSKYLSQGKKNNE
ncbi:MAG: hypothetical protein M0R74_16780 [Dehalococcoidia bacterium]|jgi:hypothetical protein|nr:hypothetical protein [Dehalococcoidia bacterium]